MAVEPEGGYCIPPTYLDRDTVCHIPKRQHYSSTLPRTNDSSTLPHPLTPSVAASTPP